MPSPLLLPVLTASVVLLVSGGSKLRDAESVDRAFTSMHVPALLDHTLVRRVLPWAEVALGAWLLLASGPALTVVGVLTLALFLAYLVLVVLALRRPEPVDCGCFGAIGDSRVTTATVWRNILLVLTAGLVVVAGVQGVSVIRTGLEGSGWGWVAVSALAAAVAVLVAWRPGGADAPGGPDVSEAEVDDDGEYVSRPAPVAQVVTETGDLELVSAQYRRAAQLLVFVSSWCEHCRRVIPLIPQWDEELGPVEVRAVVTGRAVGLEGHLEVLRGRVYFDPNGVTRTTFGMSSPSAVLLGTNGLISGGPVHGDRAVPEFVADVAAQLREAGMIPAEGEGAGADPQPAGLSDDR